MEHGSFSSQFKYSPAETLSSIEGKGRILIPKNLREKAELREGSYVRVEAKKEGILIEPLQPVADRYFGAFKIAKWPKVLDEFAVEAIKRWWTPKQAAPQQASKI